MNKPRGIVWIPILIMVASVFAYVSVTYVIYKINKEDQITNTNTNQQVCTDEAKLCPDGSYVGRTQPNCEFAECPTTIDTNVSLETNTNQQQCTLEAKLCPDGSSVGRSGPNCEFSACPGEEASANDLGLYSDETLGFSIRIPERYYAYAGTCNDVEIDYALVPTGYFSDASSFTLYRTYYYEHDGGPFTNTEPSCTQISITPDYMRMTEHAWEGWKLEFADVSNDQELEAFIKTKWGSGCSVGEKTDWEYQDGVLKVMIEGDGLDLGETKCPVNYVYQLLYHPGLARVVGWNLGQEPLFWAVNPSDFGNGASYISYDGDMTNSFRFLD